MNNKTAIILLAAAIILGAVDVSVIYLGSKIIVNQDAIVKQEQAVEQNVGLKSVPPAKSGTFFALPKIDVPAYDQKNIPNTQVQWNGNPKKLSDLKLILGYRDDYAPTGNTEDSDQYRQEFSYYQMGTRGENQIILAIAPAMDIAGPTILFFEKNTKGEYTFMYKMSPYNVFYDGDQTKQGYMLSPKIIAADTNIYYKGIIGPYEFYYKGIKLAQNYLSPSDLFSSEGKKKLDTVSEGDLYLIQTARDTIINGDENNLRFYIDQYMLKLPSGLYSKYYISYSFFSDDYVPNITWNDGVKNNDSYRVDSSMGGCGTVGGYIVYSKDISQDIIASGKTKDDQTIYEFKDINNPIVKYFYETMGGKIYDSQSGTSKDISIQEWFVHHPVIVYKNQIGEYNIFTNNKYGVQAECGKPVIYLYPEKTEQVKVQVGATITKSDPEYGNGWKTTANPDGKINYNGKVYDSLFWEGIGNGQYPSIKEGFIVRQSELKETLLKNLSDLGLTKKESQDFMEFWLPKMPSMPYVRLTWFTTQQVNELAPLYVTPKPNTTIRVFLDFEGLQSKINLPKQNLTSISRKGFTLVEWGGLLRK